MEVSVGLEWRMSDMVYTCSDTAYWASAYIRACGIRTNHLYYVNEHFLHECYFRITGVHVDRL